MEIKEITSEEIISATLSKPAKNILDFFDKEYIKIRLWKNAGINSKSDYSAEFFTQKQAFQKHLTKNEAEKIIAQNIGTSFKNCIIKTTSQEINFLSNKKGETKKIIKQTQGISNIQNINKLNREKNYLLPLNEKIDFLIELGVLTKEGKVVAAKYDKFKQINRFLDFINDILEDIKKLHGEITEENPLRIIDFGSGKSYLTFAVYYFLKIKKQLPVQIVGLDLKKDVIEFCQKLSDKLNYNGLNFYIGDIAQYKNDFKPDLIITLHACDTATDYALNYAIQKNASAILSVPCCQHEINLQLKKNKLEETNPYKIFTDYGIVQERFSALVTDLVRAKILEQNNYAVQLLEFIDFEGTPKNLLIRAVQNKGTGNKSNASNFNSINILDQLKVSQTLTDLRKTQ